MSTNSTPDAAARQHTLSGRNRSVLYLVAHRLHGATPINRELHLAAADALARRNLITYAAHADRDAKLPIICATELGREEIATLWPLCPLLLGTYDPPAGGWTPLASMPRCASRPGGSTSSDSAPGRSRVRRRR